MNKEIKFIVGAMIAFVIIGLPFWVTLLVWGKDNGDAIFIGLTATIAWLFILGSLNFKAFK